MTGPVGPVAAVFALGTAALAAPTLATDQPLGMDQVRTLVRERGPRLQLARARLAEAQAARVGADSLSATNPALAASAGPRFFPNGNTAFDLAITLAWPFDLSGSPRQHAAVGDARIVAAEQELAETTLGAEFEALKSWVDARAALERLDLERARAAVDDELLRVARVRRQAGSVGDLDVALATVVRGQGASRLRRAEGEWTAARAVLLGRLGLPAESSVGVPRLGEPEPPLPRLEELLSRLECHPSRLRAAAQRALRESEVELQDRLATPVPRALVVGEHSPEWVVRGGVELPLPFFQRNTTARAVARAQDDTARTEEEVLERELSVTLRAEYARLAGAQAAYAELETTAAAVNDAESLAGRAYELGQGTLPTLLAARREAQDARAARLDAQWQRARARIALDVAAGAFP